MASIFYEPSLYEHTVSRLIIAVAFKHKSRLLLRWHRICFGLAYMAGTSQRYNGGIMFWAWQSMLWMENLFLVALYTVLGRKVVCSLQSCHSSHFKWTAISFLLFVQGCHMPSELHSGESCLILRKQFSSLGPGLEMPWYSLFIIIILFPPAYSICTLIPAIFIHTARLLIKAWVMLG